MNLEDLIDGDVVEAIIYCDTFRRTDKKFTIRGEVQVSKTDNQPYVGPVRLWNLYMIRLISREPAA